MCMSTLDLIKELLLLIHISKGELKPICIRSLSFPKSRLHKCPLGYAPYHVSQVLILFVAACHNFSVEARAPSLFSNVINPRRTMC